MSKLFASRLGLYTRLIFAPARVCTNACTLQVMQNSLKMSPMFSHGGSTRRLATLVDSKSDDLVDMRSDVLTKPTPAVLQAMTTATNDDDVFREDQTTLEFENKMAALFGMEAALFVISGTMANLLAISCHCQQRGLEVIMGDKSHVFLWEQGGISQFCGLHSKTIPNKPDGTFDLQLVEDGIRPTNSVHQPLTGLITIENTHNFYGGKIMPLKFLENLQEIAHPQGIPIHMDGSRLYNAAVALNKDPKDIVRNVDSVSMCMSKAIGAPVGSILVGSRELISRALRMRKALGGGWRKSGPLAAAALTALEDVKSRLTEDHRLTKLFASSVMLENRGIVHIDLEGVHTNLIRVQVTAPGLTAAQLCERLGRVTDQEYKDTNCRTVVRVTPFDRTAIKFAVYSTLRESDVQRAIRKTQYVVNEFYQQFAKQQRASN